MSSFLCSTNAFKQANNNKLQNIKAVGNFFKSVFQNLTSTSQLLSQNFEVNTFESLHKLMQWTVAAGGHAGVNVHMRNIKSGSKWVRGTGTSAEPVGSSEDPAFLDLSKRREHDPDVVLVALLRHHADEQLPVFHGCKENRETRWMKRFYDINTLCMPELMLCSSQIPLNISLIPISLF